MECKELREGIEEARNALEAISSGEYCCLRYGLPYVRVSDIVMLAYCPLRLHYHMETYSEREIARRKAELRILVKALLEARRGLESSGRLFLSLPLAAVIEGVPVIGRPDVLIVENCKVKGVVVVKKTMRVGKVYFEERVKLYLYGLLVDYSPLPSANTLSLLFIKTPPEKTVDALLQLREGLSSGNGYSVYRFVYDRADALRAVDVLLKYWAGEWVEPKPRPAPSKCMKCPFSNKCWAAKHR